MDATRELVDAAQVGTALAVLSGVSLVIAVVLIILGRLKGSDGLVKASLTLSFAVAAYPLWYVYNLIEDRFGLDSILALFLNLALFVVVGIVGGMALRRLWPSTELRAAEAAETEKARA